MDIPEGHNRQLRVDNSSKEQEKSSSLIHEEQTESTTYLLHNDSIVLTKIPKKHLSIIQGVLPELLNASTRSLRKKRPPISSNDLIIDNNIKEGDNYYSRSHEDSSLFEDSKARVVGRKRRRGAPKKNKLAPSKDKTVHFKGEQKRDNKLPVQKTQATIQTTDDQVKFLFQWKTDIKTAQKQMGHYKYYETNSFDNELWAKMQFQKAQVVLISPPWNYCYKGSISDNTFTFEDFTSMNIPFELIKLGFIMIWTKKEYIGRMLQHFKTIQNTKYIENLVWWQRKHENNAKSISEGKQEGNIDSRLYKKDSPYFSSSYLTLLLFSKKDEKGHLELRHQRTSDAVYDYYDEQDPNYTPQDFVYNMIETLLPNSNEAGDLRLIEIFSIKNAHRNGWVHLNYLPSNQENNF